MTSTTKTLFDKASDHLREQYGPGEEKNYVYIPGRVNLIGEHTDYYNPAVLPIAIGLGICIVFRKRRDAMVRAVSADERGECSFHLFEKKQGRPGCWDNYLLAASLIVQQGWQIRNGIDAVITSNLPLAAGLSSSSALVAGFTIALLRANGIEPSFAELMNLLPEGEQFVGTRGGGMDHAAVLAGVAGSALHISFSPLQLSPVPIPAEWRFLVAHSLTTAEKSGAVREKYNALRVAGDRALKTLNLASYAAVLRTDTELCLRQLVGLEQFVFQHVCSEALRVDEAVVALKANDPVRFGVLLNESQQSLRDRLQISNTSVDTLVEMARDAGAVGARMTGAGFGGCVIALCHAGNVHQVQKILAERYYSERRDRFAGKNHLFVAEPSAGALIE